MKGPKVECHGLWSHECHEYITACVTASCCPNFVLNVQMCLNPLKPPFAPPESGQAQPWMASPLAWMVSGEERVQNLEGRRLAAQHFAACFGRGCQCFSACFCGTAFTLDWYGMVTLVGSVWCNASTNPLHVAAWSLLAAGVRWGLLKGVPGSPEKTPTPAVEC